MINQAYRYKLGWRYDNIYSIKHILYYSVRNTNFTQDNYTIIQRGGLRHSIVIL